MQQISVGECGSSGPVKEALCQFSYRLCYRSPLDGYDYCLHHILEDKTAPYRQCSYVCLKTDRKCPNVAPKTEKRESYCPEHIKCNTGHKKRSAASVASSSTSAASSSAGKKPRPVESAATILGELIHAQHARSGGSADGGSAGVTVMSQTAKLLEYADDTEPSDIEMIERSKVLDFNTHIDSNDPELREYEDIMRNVEVLTGEEVVRLYKEKIIRLQALYIEQFKLLQHELQEARRDYIHDVKQESSSSAATAGESSSVVEEGVRQRELKCLLSHNKHCGRARLLHDKAKQKMLSESGESFSSLLLKSAGTSTASGEGMVDVVKCPVVEQYGGGRCNEVALPATKYCVRHILYDRKQVMFRSCGGSGVSGAGGCDKVLLPGIINAHSDSLHCLLHSHPHLSASTSPAPHPATTRSSPPVTSTTCHGAQPLIKQEECSDNITSQSQLPQSSVIQ